MAAAFAVCWGLSRHGVRSGQLLSELWSRYNYEGGGSGTAERGEGGRVEDGQGGGGGSGAGFCHYSLFLVSLTLSLSVSLVKLFLVSQIPCFFYCVDLIWFGSWFVMVSSGSTSRTQKMIRGFPGEGELRWTDGRMDREGGMAFCVDLLAFRQGMDGGHSKVWPGGERKTRDWRGQERRRVVDKIWEGLVVTRETRSNGGLVLSSFALSFSLGFAEH